MKRVTLLQLSRKSKSQRLWRNLSPKVSHSTNNQSLSHNPKTLWKFLKKSPQSSKLSNKNQSSTFEWEIGKDNLTSNRQKSNPNLSLSKSHKRKSQSLSTTKPKKITTNSTLTRLLVPTNLPRGSEKGRWRSKSWPQMAKNKTSTFTTKQKISQMSKKSRSIKNLRPYHKNK